MKASDVVRLGMRTKKPTRLLCLQPQWGRRSSHILQTGAGRKDCLVQDVLVVWKQFLKQFLVLKPDWVRDTDWCCLKSEAASSYCCNHIIIFQLVYLKINTSSTHTSGLTSGSLLSSALSTRGNWCSKGCRELPATQEKRNKARKKVHSLELSVCQFWPNPDFIKLFEIMKNKLPTKVLWCHPKVSVWK